MGVQKGKHPSADLRYRKEDNFGASTFNFCCHREPTQDIDSPYPAKGTQEINSEMRIKQ